MLRIDTVQMNNVLGLRLNVWTSIVLFVARRGVLRLGRQARHPGREENVYVEGHGPSRATRSRPDRAVRPTARPPTA